MLDTAFWRRGRSFIHSGGVQALGDALRRMPRLQVLSIKLLPQYDCHDTNIGERCLSAACQAASLEALRLSNMTVHAASLARLGTLTRLKLLCLERLAGASENSESAPLLSQLPALAQLEEVLLNGTGLRSGYAPEEIRDEDLPYLARLPRLKSPLLVNTKVTAAGLRSLAASPALEQLSLCQHPKVSPAIVESLRGLRQLKKMRIDAELYRFYWNWNSRRVALAKRQGGRLSRPDWLPLGRSPRPRRRFIASAPKPERLRPLLSQEDAARWRSTKAAVSERRVLYTHEVVAGRRRAIRFPDSSPTWRYLLSHKEQLESRKYVIDAGRACYEMWVPQDPEAWSLPKIVFPDISPGARFFWDAGGSIVDGNCYWITTKDPTDEEPFNTRRGELHLDVAVPRSCIPEQTPFTARRHLTQYINEYPLPDRSRAASKQIAEVARRLVSESQTDAQRSRLEARIDALVVQAFGLECADLTDTAD